MSEHTLMQQVDFEYLQSILTDFYGTKTAAFIVRACNAHEGLFAALSKLVRAVEPFESKLGSAIQGRMPAMNTARAALATARGAGSKDE